MVLNPKPYREPEVILRAANRSGDVATIVLEFLLEPKISPPIAPASINDRASMESVFELHRLVEKADLRLKFETYDTSGELPDVGERFTFRSWWIPNAMDAVLDISAEWVRKPYDAINDHTHCLISYTTIYPLELAYFHDSHGWISIDAYEKYIQKDALRIRSLGLRTEDF